MNEYLITDTPRSGGAILTTSGPVVNEIRNFSTTTMLISVEAIKSVLDTPSCVGLRLYLIPSAEQGGNDEIYLFGFNASNEVLKDAANPQHQCYACRGGLQDAVTVGIAEGVGKVLPHTNLLRPSTSQSEYFKASFGRSRLESIFAVHPEGNLRFDIARRPYPNGGTDSFRTLTCSWQGANGELTNETIVNLLPCPPHCDGPYDEVI